MAEVSLQVAEGRSEFLPVASVADFIALLKPRVMTLVVFTGFAGLMLAPGTIHPFVAAVAVLCIAVGSGAAGALNMWYERDIDARMRRTCERPLPAGRMAPGEALGFGCVLAVGAVALMGLATNWVAAGLLAAAIAFYVFVYTIWLKRRTPQNIVIGGAAGAFPPMIGWAAVTGGVSLESAALFLLIFLWTPPHFWALALYREGDYARAGVPMLPVVAGPRATRRQILLYTLVCVPAALAPWYLGVAGTVYGVSAGILSALFVLLGLRVLHDEGDRSAKQMFGFSILYLFLLFALMIVDSGQGLRLAGGARVTIVDTADKPEAEPAEPKPVRSADYARQRRGRNLALLAALVGFVVLIYLLTVVKLGGG